MKAAVVYDSYYGNTKAVAEAIAQELGAEGHESELRSVRERYPASPTGDILFLGSPVRMGSVTSRVKRYVKRLGEGGWKGKQIIAFTTILALPENPTDEQKNSRERYDLGAGRKLRDLAREQGLSAVEDHLWAEVVGMKGPLAEGAIEKTRQFVRDVLLAVDHEE